VRAALTTEPVTLTPGRPTKVAVEVTNTLEVIDGVTASVDGGLGLTASSEPALLALFPEGTGTITLELTASRHYPAGTYDLPLDLRSAAEPSAGLVERLPVVIPPDAAATITVLPAARSSRHRAVYTVVVDNTGNVPLDMGLAASDPDRAARVRFGDPVLRVQPGESASTSLVATCRRRLLGTELSRQITVVATSGPVEVDTRAVFRHRPLIPRGARTILVLAAIVAVWAGIFIFALDKALANDPLTKVVPASFYASSVGKGGQAKLSSLGGTSSYGLASTDGGAPAGAVPKTGVVIGVGGTVSGTVEAKSTGAGIGRITVEAIRDSTHGPVLVSSAATESDGTYSIAGLLPGEYKLLFTATGYHNIWWPKATSAKTAKNVNLVALGLTNNVNVVISGGTGSIRGTIDTGETPAPPVKVTIEPEQGNKTEPIRTVTSNASGHYTVPNLPTPGTYDLSFSSAGYQVGTDSEELTGGQQETANTVTLSAGNGAIAGTVTDGKQPVGGVAITASADGQTFTSATPTSGAVGQFNLSNLPTPATYLLTFTKPGFGTRSVAEILGPGQSLTTVAVKMSGGAGDINGAVDAHGIGLGGVKVTVNGGSTALSAQTLTAGDVGSYALSGLATPGRYTLTFSLAGYESQTIGVSLGSSGATIVPTVTLQPATGTVTGSVSGSSGPLAGVTVSITNGTTISTTTTSSSPAGGFSFTGLSPGAYSVTFADTDESDAAVTVILHAGEVTPPIVVALKPADGT
jgi:5-hydroxyisourate hydrolase-like protein (transthyretin family)